MTSINNSLFFLLFTSTDNNIGDTGATSLSESLKLNTTLTKLNLSSEDRRKKAHKCHPSTSHSSKQATGLNAKEKQHWKEHLRQTQHSLNSICRVSKVK